MRSHLYRSPYPARTVADTAPEALPYPSGWFCLGFSREWPPGTVRTRGFMGADVVVYRTRNGVLRAVGPHCPHLGAHLGAGGTVEGELLVCPFHRFGFAVDGTCVRTPYGTPPRASLDRLTVRESRGIVWAWHAPDGTPPSWELPDLPAVARPRRVHRTAVAGHAQDVMENFVDYGHVTQLHRVDFLEVRSEPKADGPFYRASFRVGRPVPLLPAVQDIELLILGMGAGLLTIAMDRPRLRAAQWVFATPVAPGRLHYTMAANAVTGTPPHHPAALHRPLLDHAVGLGMNRWNLHAARADFPVFHHKTYLPHPRLNDEDGPIGAYRRWARQFHAPVAG
ncbi:Rieske 2Fe-2S domain-containing protein [Streptomyces gamaensis]|uniref:Rieske-type oxygenase n=1 Tax=Streptomyces gamaensis TaxID=1763542 RepID=A0ABW0YZW1_9ACTN